MEGVYASEFKRGLFEVCAFERNNSLKKGLFSFEFTCRVKAGDYCAYLEHRVGCRIEASGFHVDDDRQVASKAGRHH